MIILGITGSIGMGKSTLVDRLKQEGIPVHESDATVHELFLNDLELIRKIGELFPKSLEKGAINRQKLASIVFTNNEDLKQLEELVHPKVRLSRTAFLADHKAKKTPIIAIEIPLLYERGYDTLCDYIFVVTCSQKSQEERVLTRPGMTRERLAKIRSLQLAESEKLRRADFIIDSELPYEQTFAKLTQILEDIRLKHNLSCLKDH